MNNNGSIRASSPNPNLNSSISSTDSNANLKQRNVAFGKQITNNLQYLPYSASKSATNIYHHQLVLYQHPEPPSIPSPPLSQGFQKQRGVSVPNLGFPHMLFLYKQTHFFLYINLFEFVCLFLKFILI